MTRLFNFFKKHPDIIRVIIFLIIGAAMLYVLYRLSVPETPHYIQENKTIDLKNTNFNNY